jgi:hypothetical protein
VRDGESLSPGTTGSIRIRYVWHKLNAHLTIKDSLPIAPIDLDCPRSHWKAMQMSS